MARRKKNVYFERKTPGRDSLLIAVKDIGRVGVNSPKEVGALAMAQLLDWLDGWTVDKKTGKKVKFTGKKWAGRTKVLRILASKYGGKAYVSLAQKLKKAVELGMLSKSAVRIIVKKIVKIYRLPVTRFKI